MNTVAAEGHANVKALVYVSAFEPDVGETSGALTAHDPGATLSAALAPPVPLADGSHDLYVDVAKFHAQFAADTPDAIPPPPTGTRIVATAGHWSRISSPRVPCPSMISS